MFFWSYSLFTNDNLSLVWQVWVQIVMFMWSCQICILQGLTISEIKLGVLFENDAQKLPIGQLGQNSSENSLEAFEQLRTIWLGSNHLNFKYMEFASLSHPRLGRWLTLGTWNMFKWLNLAAQQSGLRICGFYAIKKQQYNLKKRQN